MRKSNKKNSNKLSHRRIKIMIKKSNEVTIITTIIIRSYLIIPMRYLLRMSSQLKASMKWRSMHFVILKTL